MPQIFGTLVSNEVKNGKQIMVWDIPALASASAKARGNVNARLKSLKGATVSSVENIGKAGLPGQKLFRVTVTAQPT